MMKKSVSLFLSLVLLLSLATGVYGAPMGDREAEPETYTGTLSDSTDLLFEFDNREKDQARYKGAAYGGYNFDQETKGYWATAYNGSATALKPRSSRVTIQSTLQMQT